MTIERNDSIDIKDGPNYDIWRTPNLTHEQFESLPVGEKLIYFTTLAHMAPSSHNTQPWAFSPDEKDSSITLYLDRDRVLPASDVRGRQAVISVGAALTNVQVAASHFGLEATTENEQVDPSQVLPYKQPDDKNRYVKLCQIGFNPSVAASDKDLFASIFTRRVNRNITDTSKTIPGELLTEIGALEGDGTRLFLLKAGDPIIPTIAEFQGAADTVVANLKSFRRELGDWLQENNTKDPLGMPGDTFGMDDTQARHTKNALLGKEKLEADDISAFSRGSILGIRSSAITGMITVDKDTPEYWLKSGELLGKIGLKLTSQGLSYAVHAGLAEVSLTRFGLSAISLWHGTPAILFRAGYPRPDLEIPPHSPRLPIEEVLIKPVHPKTQI